MTLITNTNVVYWDMYFILKLLPTPGEWVTVDLKEGQREFLVMAVMNGYRHIKIKEEGCSITEISVTKQGVNFFTYLKRIGFGTKESEQYGKTVIAELEREYYKLN